MCLDHASVMARGSLVHGLTSNESEIHQIIIISTGVLKGEQGILSRSKHRKVTGQGSLRVNKFPSQRFWYIYQMLPKLRENGIPKQIRKKKKKRASSIRRDFPCNAHE